jgi:hypothetical protein
MKYLGEILFILINAWIADYQAHQFAVGKSISHFFWAAVIGFLIAGGWYVEHADYWFAGALLLERVWAFNPMLNKFRNKPFFYTHSGKNGSWIDAHIGDSYPWIFVTALAAFMVINIFFL